MDIRRAEPADQAAILSLLAENGLPVTGALEHLTEFRVADEYDQVLGVAGLEVHGTVALLRSVAVDRSARRLGVATALCRSLLAEARRAGIGEVYLRTESAETYFRRLGFRRICRKLVDPRLNVSTEFRGTAGRRAITMRLALQPDIAEPDARVRCGREPCPCPDQL